MKFLEKDLEDIIFESLQFYDTTQDLINRGLKITPNPFLVYRQLNLNEAGIADLVTINLSVDAFIDNNKVKISHLNIEVSVFELKKEIIDFTALGQICRYMKCMEIILNHLEEKYKISIATSLKGYLIGSKIQDAGDFVFATEYMENISVYLYDYKLDGIKFKRQFGWHFSSFNEDLVIKKYMPQKFDFINLLINKIKEEYGELQN